MALIFCYFNIFLIGVDGMNFFSFLYIALLVIIISICAVTSFFVIYKTILKSRNRVNELSFEELFEIVNIIISNEISLYERNIFNNKGKILDKASYDNYYKDILQNVYNALSDEIVNSVTVYLDRESFYTMISREIQIYLNSKIME